jgi:hypothetical protein
MKTAVDRDLRRESREEVVQLVVEVRAEARIDTGENAERRERDLPAGAVPEEEHRARVRRVLVPLQLDRDPLDSLVRQAAGVYAR